MSRSANRQNSVAERLGLRIERRLAGGEFGAWLARTAGGQQVVLKLLPPHPRLTMDWVAPAIELAAALRRDGYPVPRHLDAGTLGGQVYTVQELVEGTTPDRLHSRQLRQLLDLWRRHRNLATRVGVGDRGWAAAAVAGLRVGSDRVYVDHAVIRTSPDRRVHRVLDAAISIGERTDPAVFRTGDVVHADLHHGNLLVRGEEIVAVLDWEGAHAGDARFDLVRLATVAYQDPAAAHDLLAAERAATGAAEVRTAVLALGALQNLTFAVGHRPEALEWALTSARGLAASRD